MSNYGRAAITCGAAVLIGAWTYASASDLDRDAIVFSTPVALAVVFVPVLAVALVNRWWALSVALVPFAVAFYLHEFTDYVYPFHEDSYPVGIGIATPILLGYSALGFLLRAFFDRVVCEVWLPRLRNKLGEGQKS